MLPATRIPVALVAAAVGLAAAGAASTTQTTHPALESREVLSEVYAIDRLYRSMQGPQSVQMLSLLDDSSAPELLWITGFDAVMVGADGETPMPQEFMCHSNFEIKNTREHERLFGRTLDTTNPRFFTLSQGQLSIQFPDGFGIPVMSNETFQLRTQVLNLNHPKGAEPVRHKIRVDFVRDRQAGRPFTPLVATGANVLVSLENRPLTWGTARPTAEQGEATCLPGHAVGRVPDVDSLGRKFSGHFRVLPGRQVYRTLATKQLAFEQDTTIHYIAVHLHPFAESIELRDLTEGKTLYRSKARGFSDRIGLDHVDSYADVAGIPVAKDHEYEVVAVYNNTTKKLHDAMAVLFVYTRDLQFRRPAGPE